MRTLGLLLLLSVLAGCGAAKSKVSGRVLYQGSPMPGGLVTFHPADPKQNAVAVSLDEQGNYEAMLPVGEVKVAIDNRQLQPRSAGPRGIPHDLPEEARNALSNAKPSTAPPSAGSPTPSNHADNTSPSPPSFTPSRIPASSSRSSRKNRRTILS